MTFINNMIPVFLCPLSPSADVFESPQEIFLWLLRFFSSQFSEQRLIVPKAKGTMTFQLIFLLCAFTAFLIPFQSFLLYKMFVASWYIEITDRKYIWNFIYLVITWVRHSLSTTFWWNTLSQFCFLKPGEIKSPWKVAVSRVSKTASIIGDSLGFMEFSI